MQTKPALKESIPSDTTLHEELLAVGEDDIVEMANLFTEETGVEGVIFVSTEMASHGPRVKYSRKVGRHQPSFSVSISREPRILARSSDIADHVLAEAAPRVIQWVKLNRDALLNFWQNGTTWSRQQESTFFDSLKKLARD